MYAKTLFCLAIILLTLRRDGLILHKFLKAGLQSLHET